MERGPDLPNPITPPLSYPTERLAIAHFMVAITRDLYRALHPTRAADYARHLDTLLVACAVTIGHIEARPMTVTKVAIFLGLPRSTAARRLAELTAAGAIVRRAAHYYVADSGPAQDAATIARIGRHYRELALALRQI